MDNSSFWLVHIDNSYVTVGLCQVIDSRPQLTSLGQPAPWTNLEPESLISAVDQSLSESSSLINLPSEEEPSQAAFVVAPGWIDNDGKILPEYLKQVKLVCKKLDLKPLGFIPNDEAILESANNKDGFPVSFILAYLTPTGFDLSLVYLGKIKERLHHDLTDSFTPADLESSLTELQTQSTLPPQIIVFGYYSQETIDALKNYAWVGKKNIETFLHFPDIQHYSLSDVFNIYLKVIFSQFQPHSEVHTSINSEPEIEPEPVETVVEDHSDEPQLLEITDAASLGFSEIQNEPEIEPTEKFSPDTEVDSNLTLPPPPAVIPTPKLNFPKFKFSLPRIQIIFSRYILFIFALSPLLLILPLLLLKAKVSIILTPLEFSKTQSVILDPEAGSISGNIIPVKLKSVDLTATASVPASGQKTLGEKAAGEVVIYNQSARTLNIPKNTVVTSDSGLKFEFTSDISVASSSADYDTGIITMGQTRANVSAVDIGPEYNLAKDQKLTFKDSAGIQVLTKVKDGLSGGTKREVLAIGSQDKTDVDAQINQQIAALADSGSNAEINSTPGILPYTITTKKQRIEYNREIGEEAEELTATAKSTISVLYLEDINKSAILNFFFASNPDYADSKISLSDFSFQFTPDPNSTDKTKGTLAVSGKTLPKIDISPLPERIKGKTKKQADLIIRNYSKRIYSYHIDSKFFLLPFIGSRITIEVN